MIARIWHGWTTPGNADGYERLLREEILPGIATHVSGSGVTGYRGVQVLRHQHTHEVEFVVIMRFDSLDVVKAFAGDDYAVAYVPEKARALLARFDARAMHYEICEQLDY